MKVTLKLYFDYLNGVGVDLRFGTILTELLLWRNGPQDESPAYELPEAIVVSKPTSVDVRGKVEVTVSVKNRGTYTENTF